MAKKKITVLSNHKIQDNHLMNTIGGIVTGLTGVQSTILHSNTIKVIGNGLGDALQTIVDQIPVLDMKVYKVNPKNVKHTDLDVHIIYFTPNLLDANRRMNGHI